MSFTFDQECALYQNEAEIHKATWGRFVEYVNETPYLKEHRDFVEKNFLGFGDRAFHWLWKLLVDEMPQEFSFLEVGVYCGQVLSLVPYIASKQGKQCKTYGVTLLNRFNGEKPGATQFPDVNYLERIRFLHEHFGIPLSLERLLIGSSIDPEIQARARELPKFDMVYIDGCHDYKYVISDLQTYGAMVKPGGYLIVDDSSCNLKMWWGAFPGIDDVSRAVEDVIISSSEWEHKLAVMHDRVFLRRR